MAFGVLVEGGIVLRNGVNICRPAQQTEKIKVEGDSHGRQGVCNHQKIQGFKENSTAVNSFFFMVKSSPFSVIANQSATAPR